MSVPEKLRVLIPQDGSEPGEAALLEVRPLIRSGPVECTLLHATGGRKPAEGLEGRLKVHREALEKLGAPTRIRFVSGKPCEEILQQTANGEFDLVAMSTHGRRGLDRVMMGSVAEAVVRSSIVPTLLCRTGTSASTWDHIVVALDGMAGAEEVLDDVRRLARRLNSTVHLVRVGLNLLRSNAYRGVHLEVPVEESSSYLEDVAAKLMAEGIRITTDQRSGRAAAEIAQFARDVDAGLICMTTQGRHEELPGLDRSVAAEVIRQAPCPVYVRRMTGSACRDR
jgi:nucleotide-binding universal stress UspA family protein